MKPIIAIIGRPNVGKSTLFNRLLRRRQAIVEDEPGVTRDRLYGEATFDDHSFILIDTGGFEPTPQASIQKQVREQAEIAIEEADLILFLLDGQEGLTYADLEVANYLRQVAKPVIYVVNKIDTESQEKNLFDFYRLGVAKLQAISAEHGRGIPSLMEEVLRLLPPPTFTQESSEAEIRVAIVGRPNVGKSSLLNRLLGSPRAIVDATPGTTRDALDTPLYKDGQKYIFIDTAGIKRRSKLTKRLEKIMTLRALRSLERCDVALITIDGWEGLTEQDKRIAEFAAENGRAMILIVNKWDLVIKDAQTKQRYLQRIHQEMRTLDFVPVLFISALTGQGIEKIFKLLGQVIAEHRKRIATAELNKWLKEIGQKYPPPLAGTRAVKLYYMTQVEVAPPTFVIFTNLPEEVDTSYQRYLLRQLREKFGFLGTPLRLYWRAKK
ncbi:MAG: ribosome biogenesis GTPase Der [Thermodesulfobacteriota bacterium]